MKRNVKAIMIAILIAIMVFLSCANAIPEGEKYWINSKTNVRHNNSCQYYGNTEEGYYTDEEVGTACGICGG